MSESKYVSNGGEGGGGGGKEGGREGGAMALTSLYNIIGSTCTLLDIF